jgi:hypothetical protein
MDNYKEFYERLEHEFFNLIDDQFDDDDFEDDDLDELENQIEENKITVTNEWEEGSVVRRDFIEETDELPEGMSWGEFCDYTFGYKVPKGCRLVRNRERMQTVLSMINSFAQAVWDIDSNASVDIEQSEYDGTHLVATVRCSLLCDEAVKELSKLLPLTFGCDMMALTDGRLELNLEFDDMFNVVSR